VAAYAPASDRIDVIFEYTRLSNDPGEARADHVTQNRGIASAAERHGFPRAEAARRYSDDDRSASKADVERPGYEAMLRDMASLNRRTHRPVLIVWNQDRPSRRLDTSQAIADLIWAQRGLLVSDKQGEFTMKPGTRGAFYFGAIMSAQYAEDVQSKTSDGTRTAAIQGKRHGIVPYGWSFELDGIGRNGKAVGRQVINPGEADVIRTAAECLLKGESLRSMALALNELGIPSPSAGKTWRGRPVIDEWNSQKLRHLLIRPANAGIRVHARGAGSDHEEQEFSAAWPEILDATTFRRVCGLLADPARRSQVSSLPVHLLSGIATCGECGKAVISQRKEKGSDSLAYRCATWHVQRDEPRTDAVVESWVLTYLAQPQVRSALRQQSGDDQGQTERLEGITARTTELEAMFSRGSLSPAQFERLNRGLLAEAAEAQRILSATTNRAVYADLISTDDTEAAWAAMPMGRKRSIVAALFTVTILKSAKRGRYAFDPASIIVTPKGV
jgi:DNA invertase Pin-like site-specific DNA recombinase